MIFYQNSVEFNHSVMSDSAAPWTAACQASLSIINSQNLLKLTSIELVMPCHHLILCHPLLLLPLIFPSIRVFSNELALPSGSQSVEASASASVLAVNIQSWFPLGLTGLIFLLSKGLSRVFSSTSVQRHQFFGAQSLLMASSHNHWVLIMKKLPVRDNWEDHNLHYMDLCWQSNVSAFKHTV